jgi:hypothetical protein
VDKKAVADVMLAFIVAPALFACLPAIVGRRRSATDLHGLVFTHFVFLMPATFGVIAWFAAWRLQLAHGSASQPAAIVVGVLFCAESLLLCVIFSIGAAMSGSLGPDRPEHPFRFACSRFWSWTYGLALLNIPLALVVTVIVWWLGSPWKGTARWQCRLNCRVRLLRMRPGIVEEADQ